MRPARPAAGRWLGHSGCAGHCGSAGGSAATGGTGAADGAGGGAAVLSARGAGNEGCREVAREGSRRHFEGGGAAGGAMIRWALIAGAVLMSALASSALLRETRFVMRSDEPGANYGGFVDKAYDELMRRAERACRTCDVAGRRR